MSDTIRKSRKQRLILLDRLEWQESNGRVKWVIGGRAMRQGVGDRGDEREEDTWWEAVDEGFRMLATGLALCFAHITYSIEWI